MKTYNRVCRGCNQEVTLERHNQRYCAPCREAKEAAALAARTVACNGCGEVKYCTYGICENCQAAKDREERAQADRREVRRIRRFGPCPNHPDKPASHDGVCVVCHQAKGRERRKQAYWAAQREKQAAQSLAEQEEERQLAARYARLDDTQKALVNVMLLLRGGSVPEWLTQAAAEPEPTVDEVDPEEQAAIDADFLDIMADFDL